MSGPVDEFTGTQEETAMIDSYAVQHCEHVGQRSFETVVAAIEAEFATLPSLPNVADWNAYQAALQALTLIPNLSRAEPAARLTEPKGNGASRQPAVLVANNDKQTTAIGAQVNEQCTDSDGEKKEHCPSRSRQQERRTCSMGKGQFERVRRSLALCNAGYRPAP
jgi:hypothetical protein